MDIWIPNPLERFWMQGEYPGQRKGLPMMTATLQQLLQNLGFPLVMKVVGPVHKSDVGGVALGIENLVSVKEHFNE